MFEKTYELETSGLVNPDTVKKIEALKLDLNQKGELVLVEGGIKPAAWIEFDVRIWSEGDKPTDLMTEEEINRFFETIGQMNVLSRQISREIRIQEQAFNNSGENRWRSIKVFHDHTGAFIGSTRENLDRLVEAAASGDHNKIGKALGYPLTAIEAFVGKRRKLDLKSVPKDTLMSEGMAFTTPTLSEDNWTDEIKLGQAYAKFLKENSPEIYKSIMKKRLDTLKMWGLL